MAQIKKDGVARLGEGRPADATAEDATLAALRQIGRDGTDIATVQQSIMGAVDNGSKRGWDTVAPSPEPCAYANPPVSAFHF